MSSSYEVCQSDDNPNGGSSCCIGDKTVCSEDIAAASTASSLSTVGSDLEQLNQEHPCAVSCTCLDKDCVIEMTNENENSDSSAESASLICQDLVVCSAGVPDSVGVGVEKLVCCGEEAQLDLKIAVAVQHSAMPQNQCCLVANSDTLCTQLPPDTGNMEGSNNVECRKRPSIDQDSCEIHMKLQKLDQSLQNESVSFINNSVEASDLLEADQQISDSHTSSLHDASKMQLLESCAVETVCMVGKLDQPQETSLQPLEPEVLPKLQQTVEKEISLLETGDQSEKHLIENFDCSTESVAISSVASAANSAANAGKETGNEMSKSLVNLTESVLPLPPPPSEKDSCSAAKMRKRMEALLGPKSVVGNELSACKQIPTVNEQVAKSNKSSEMGDQDSQVLSKCIPEAKETNSGHEDTDLHCKLLTESVSVDSHKSDTNLNLDFVDRLKNSKRLAKESSDTSNKMPVPLMSLKTSEMSQTGSKRPAPLMNWQPPDGWKPKCKSSVPPDNCEADVTSCSQSLTKNILPLMDCNPFEKQHFLKGKKVLPQLEGRSLGECESATVKPRKNDEVKEGFEISLSEEEREMMEICEHSRMSQLNSATETAALTDKPVTCGSTFLPSVGSSTASASVGSQFQCFEPHQTQIQQTENRVLPSVCLSQSNDCISLSVSSTPCISVGPPAPSFCRAPACSAGQQISGNSYVHQTDGKIPVPSSQQFMPQSNCPTPALLGSQPNSMELQASGCTQMMTLNEAQTGNLSIVCKPAAINESHSNASRTVNEQASAQVVQPQPMGPQAFWRLPASQPRPVLPPGDLQPSAPVSQHPPVLPSSDLMLPTPVNQPRPVPPPGDLLSVVPINQPTGVPSPTGFRPLALASQPGTVPASSDLALSPVNQLAPIPSSGDFRPMAVAPAVRSTVNLRPTAPSFDCRPPLNTNSQVLSAANSSWHPKPDGQAAAVRPPGEWRPPTAEISYRPPGVSPPAWRPPPNNVNHLPPNIGYPPPNVPPNIPPPNVPPPGVSHPPPSIPPPVINQLPPSVPPPNVPPPDVSHPPPSIPPPVINQLPPNVPPPNVPPPDVSHPPPSIPPPVVSHLPPNVPPPNVLAPSIPPPDISHPPPSVPPTVVSHPPPNVPPPNVLAPSIPPPDISHPPLSVPPPDISHPPPSVPPPIVTHPPPSVPPPSVPPPNVLPPIVSHSAPNTVPPRVPPPDVSHPSGQLPPRIPQPSWPLQPPGDNDWRPPHVSAPPPHFNWQPPDFRPPFSLPRPSFPPYAAPSMPVQPDLMRPSPPQWFGAGWMAPSTYYPDPNMYLQQGWSQASWPMAFPNWPSYGQDPGYYGQDTGYSYSGSREDKPLEEAAREWAEWSKQYAEWYKAYFGIDVTSVSEQTSETQPAADSAKQPLDAVTSTSTMVSSTKVKNSLTASTVVSSKEASTTVSVTPVSQRSVCASVLPSSVNKQLDVTVTTMPLIKQSASSVHNTSTITKSSSSLSQYQDVTTSRVESKSVSSVTVVNSSLLNSSKPSSHVTSESKPAAG
jgi:hypothetical protein